VKKYVFTEEQIARLACVLNCITVTGMQQAEMLTICKQVLDAPLEIIEEDSKDEPEHN
jgi:hypothetical protein